MAKKLNGQNPQSSGKIEEKPDRNPDGTFAVGRDKTGGREKGITNFKTDFDEVVEEIAKANNISFSDARKILLKKAYSEAKNGQFNFYKDIIDRYYGKAEDNLKLTGDLIIQISKEIADKNNVSDASTKPNSG